MRKYGGRKDAEDVQHPPDSPRRSARARVMDLLAKRNHSEFELRKKLRENFAEQYEDDEVTAAIEFARESKWLLPEAELSERVAVGLGRKRKGHRFINQYLKQKGLPPVTKSLDAELEKATAIVETKIKDHGALEFSGPIEEQRKTQQKIYRLLANRGFDEDTIHRVIASFRRKKVN